MAEMKKVVCIEDEPDMVHLVELLLKDKGFEVIGAVGGRKGLETIRRVKPDLVLLDLMMPDVNGTEIYRQMKAAEELKHIPIIVLTAQIQSIDKTLWRQVLKVDDYIVKPFESHRLIESVERILAAEPK